MIDTNKDILSLINVKKYFPLYRGLLKRTYAEVKAVDGVSLSVKEGEVLGIVGESGSGKTTLARCIIQVEAITSGKIIFRGRETNSNDKSAVSYLRKNIQMIFQDPYKSLNPQMKVGAIVSEPLVIQRLVKNREEARRKAEELLESVKLEPWMVDLFPHEFSGGQRQRIAIARALATKPALVLCDEPLSALDVSVQMQILQLFGELRNALSLTLIFISHDLAVVREISDAVAVMYLGKIMEISPSEELYSNPYHPYTKALISASPIPDPTIERDSKKRIILKGSPANPINPPPGCRFHSRCQEYCGLDCENKEPILREVSPGHFAACHAL